MASSRFLLVLSAVLAVLGAVMAATAPSDGVRIAGLLLAAVSVALVVVSWRKLLRNRE